MIPFLVIEIIWRVIFGFALCAIWICFVLTAFGLITFKVELELITPTEILLVASVLSTLVFLGFIKLLLTFYQGYRIVKKANDRQRMYGSNFCRMKTSFTGKPTSL
uniref:Uncharacterized protein n=1 Tax=Acrobeloides nanus TaxID=290746 RepID=A0A914E5M2_9BILA